MRLYSKCIRISSWLFVSYAQVLGQEIGLRAIELIKALLVSRELLLEELEKISQAIDRKIDDLAAADLDLANFGLTSSSLRSDLTTAGRNTSGKKGVGRLAAMLGNILEVLMLCIFSPQWFVLLCNWSSDMFLASCCRNQMALLKLEMMSCYIRYRKKNSWMCLSLWEINSHFYGMSFWSFTGVIICIFQSLFVKKKSFNPRLIYFCWICCFHSMLEFFQMTGLILLKNYLTGNLCFLLELQFRPVIFNTAISLQYP